MTIGNPAFCHLLHLTNVHFRGKLQHVGNVSQQKIYSRPIKTREIGGVSLSDVVYATHIYVTKAISLKICSNYVI